MASRALVLAWALVLSSCTSSTPASAVRGEFAGERLDTRVDGPMASYYAEHYAAGARLRPEWDAVLDEIHGTIGERLPSREELRDWSRSYSTDLAALVFARQLFQHGQREPLHRLFYEELSRLGRGGAPDALSLDPEFVFLFVPGWLYRTDPGTGADFARFRTLLAGHGADVALVETGENLPVEDNARIIEFHIRRLERSGRPVILVSGSKGGPEAALALSMLRDDPAGRNVKAWVNIGGLLRGTPLADLALTWPACWLVHLAILPDGSFEGIRSVSTPQSAVRLDALKLPQDTLVVNYLGIPLSGDVSHAARFGYSRLRAEGPNDGLTFLSDGLAPGGITIAELGADHYFRRADIDLKTLALARALARYLKPGDAERG